MEDAAGDAATHVVKEEGADQIAMGIQIDPVRQDKSGVPIAHQINMR
jgi:hypothetical protein